MIKYCNLLHLGAGTCKNKYTLQKEIEFVHPEIYVIVITPSTLSCIYNIHDPECVARGIMKYVSGNAREGVL